MSDEAFARRFYSDRAELVSLGVPLDSQRDEHTGEELYTLRSERYFLPPLELDDDEFAALQTSPLPARRALRVLRAAAARAPEPRARTQLGGPRRLAHRHRGARRGARSRLLAGAARPAREARRCDHEAAHRPLPLLVDRPRQGERANDQPVRPASGERHVVRDRRGPGRQDDQAVSRLTHPLRDPLRHAPRARFPRTGGVRRRELPRPRRLAVRRHGRRGSDRARSRHRLVGATRVRQAAQHASTATSSPPNTPSCRCSRAGSSARTAVRFRSSRPRCASW